MTFYDMFNLGQLDIGKFNLFTTSQVGEDIQVYGVVEDVGWLCVYLDPNYTTIIKTRPNNGHKWSDWKLAPLFEGKYTSVYSRITKHKRISKDVLLSYSILSLVE